MTTIPLLIDKLEQRYPNDIFKLEKLSEEERNQYIAALNMIEEIKQIGGLEDETK